MSDIVFILGAGASVSAGAPLMHNFLDVARRLAREKRCGDTAPAFERVFEICHALQAVHSKARVDLVNIESLLTLLEMGRLLNVMPGCTTDGAIEKAIADLKMVIVRTIELTMEFDLDEAGRYQAKEHYLRLAEMIGSLTKKGRSVSVVTFNYDLGIDVALYNKGVEYTYALGTEPESARRGIPLLKLHGSLNWAQAKNEPGVLSHPVAKYRPVLHTPSRFQLKDQKYYLSNVGSCIDKFDFGGIPVRAEPVIVPPTWNKAPYHEALTAVWREAAKNLARASEIYVLGYSLPITDTFFRHLYALGSIGEPLQCFAVYNPADDDTEARFRSLLGPGAEDRFTYTRQTFGDAVMGGSTGVTYVKQPPRLSALLGL